MIKRTIALTTVAAVIAVPAALLVAGPAHADVEREKHGTCGSGRYELNVDSEGRGYEVNVDLDNVTAGSKWRIVIKQDGMTKANIVRTAERDGDVDLERYLPNTAGKDVIRFKATRVGASTSCTGALTVA